MSGEIDARCVTGGAFKTSLDAYLTNCRAGQYPAAVSQFFSQAYNIPAQFENMKIMYDDYDSTYNNIISSGNVLTFVGNLDKSLDYINNEIKDLETQKRKLDAMAERNERRFIEEQISAGDDGDDMKDVGKIRMFQDKVLAILFITYIFAVVTVIAVIARQSGYNWKIIAGSVLIILFITIVLFSILKIAV